jgi:GTP-binding protein HflX
LSKRLFGNTTGLKPYQIRRLENLYRRRVQPGHLISYELARDISKLSAEIRRQIGLMISRRGRIIYVIVGDAKKIVIPSTRDYRAAPGRLMGLRCVHTHLKNEALSQDDLTDLALLRLDLMAAIAGDGDGKPLKVHAAHILPGARRKRPYQIMDPLVPHEMDVGCLELIHALEDELAREGALLDAASDKERALLVAVSSASRSETKATMAELRELADSSGMHVLGTEVQQRARADARFVIGAGKLQALAIRAMQEGATIIVFDQELSPTQIRSITDQIDLKVIDRTQLILDIFAQRAQTREGKLQVELAQLKYMLPRLIGKNTAMSRLTGGIGGRGPGETKLEIDRRRVRDRIGRLEKALAQVRTNRGQQRAKRNKKGLPIVSIIGYTNAGKSTLLNTLTNSRVRAENRLFATLDPSSRRLRFPRDTEVIITDTVGFIKDLPGDLMVAFRATLEELESADLLLHVVDISNPRFQDQIEAVERTLRDLKLQHTTTITVLNKQDLVEPELVENISRRHKAVAVCARQRSTLRPLISIMEQAVSAETGKAVIH